MWAISQVCWIKCTHVCLARRFMWEYSTVLQFVKLGAFANFLMFLGAPYHNVLLFLTAAPILAAFRWGAVVGGCQ